MTLATGQSMVLAAGLGVLVLWRVYRRIRRMVGRQRLSRVRPWFTVTLFPLLIVFLALATLAHPAAALGLLAGVAAGVGLGELGLRLTRFEATPAGLFYTPNAHLGIALSLLFIGRLVYRLGHAYLVDGTAPFSQPPSDMTGSPLTLMIFGTLAGYYVRYAVGLLQWRHRVTRSAPTPAAEGSMAGPPAEPPAP